MFQTTAIWLSGSIIGETWMPQYRAGKPVDIKIDGPLGYRNRFAKKASIRDILLSILMDHGGDFQNPLFGDNTEIVIQRHDYKSPGKYSVHLKHLEIAKLHPDLTTEDDIDWGYDC